MTNLLLYQSLPLIPIRILILPVPAVTAHLFYAVLGFPTEFGFGLGRVAVASGDVTGTAGLDGVGDFHSVDFLKGGDYVQNGIAVAGTDVIDGEAALALNGFQGADMGAGEVNDMDIVAHSCAIGGVVVISKNSQFFTLAYGNLGDVGHQVIGDTVGILTYQAALVCADGVEVAEEYDVPLLVGTLEVHQDFFQHALGLSVGVGAMALGALLGDGDDGRIAIDGGGGGEDDVFASVLTELVEQDEGAVHVVLVIFQGFGNTLTDGFQTSKVDAGIELVLVHDGRQCRTVADIDFVEGDFFTDDGGYTYQGFFLAVHEVVNNNHFVTCFVKFNEGVGTDVTGSACNENFHKNNMLMWQCANLPIFIVFIVEKPYRTSVCFQSKFKVQRLKRGLASSDLQPKES